MTASVGEGSKNLDSIELLTIPIYGSILRLTEWFDENDYHGYDKFDGLNAGFLRPFIFEAKVLGQVLEQGVRRFTFKTTVTIPVGLSIRCPPFTRAHRGQATILRALSRLYKQLCTNVGSV